MQAVPAEYITTDVALVEMLEGNVNPLRSKVPDSAGHFSAEEVADARSDARHIEAGVAAVLAALQKQDLVALALVRRGRDWSPHSMPDYYWEASDTALWTGKVIGLELRSDDRWLDGATLCFRCEEWKAWLAGAQAKTEETSLMMTAPAGNVPFSDHELVTRVADMVDGVNYKTARAAAYAVSIEDIPGYGTEDSRRRRLAEKVRDELRARRRKKPL